MTLEEYTRATPLIKKLKKLHNASKQIENAKPKIQKMNEGGYEGGEYNGRISEYSDGSGWNIDVTGCGVVSKIIEKIEEIITEETIKTQNELNQIGNKKQFNPK